MDRIVVKVGGSLFDLPELGSRLRRWLDGLNSRAVILLPGGGRMADVVRDLDRIHGLGEERSHWLALRTLTCNAHILAELLPASGVAGTFADCAALHQGGRTAIIDAFRFALDDEAHPEHLPHTWQVTSDSIAARIAVRWQADRLILLKSLVIPAPIDWQSAGQLGYVDSHFHQVVQGLEVNVVNFR